MSDNQPTVLGTLIGVLVTTSVVLIVGGVVYIGGGLGWIVFGLGIAAGIAAARLVNHPPAA